MIDVLFSTHFCPFLFLPGVTFSNYFFVSPNHPKKAFSSSSSCSIFIISTAVDVGGGGKVAENPLFSDTPHVCFRIFARVGFLSHRPAGSNHMTVIGVSSSGVSCNVGSRDWSEINKLSRHQNSRIIISCFCSFHLFSFLRFISWLFSFFVSIFLSSAWGEGLFLAIQTAIIAALVLLYGSGSTKGIIIVFVTNSSLSFLRESPNTFS